MQVSPDDFLSYMLICGLVSTRRRPALQLASTLLQVSLTAECHMTSHFTALQLGHTALLAQLMSLDSLRLCMGRTTVTASADLTLVIKAQPTQLASNLEYIQRFRMASRFTV